jgi:hypothetical protein
MTDTNPITLHPLHLLLRPKRPLLLSAASVELLSGRRLFQTVSFSLPELEAKISPDATLEFSVDGAASIAVLMKHWPTVRHIEPAVSHGIQVELALHAAQAVSSDNLDSISLNSVSVGECATNARHLWQMSTAVQRARVGQVLLVTVQATTAVDLSSLRLSCSLPGGIRTLDAASSLTEQRIVSPSCLADDRSRSNHVEPHFRRVIDLERVRFVSLPSSLVTAGTNSFTFAVLAGLFLLLIHFLSNLLYSFTFLVFRGIWCIRRGL